MGTSKQNTRSRQSAAGFVRSNLRLARVVAHGAAEERVRGHGEERALPDDREAAVEPGLGLRDVEDVLERREAERHGDAVDDAVERLVELVPVVDGREEHDRLGRLLDVAARARTTRRGAPPRCRSRASRPAGTRAPCRRARAPPPWRRVPSAERQEHAVHRLALPAVAQIEERQEEERRRCPGDDGERPPVHRIYFASTRLGSGAKRFRRGIAKFMLRAEAPEAS